MQYNYEPFFDPELNSDYNIFYNNFKEDLYHEHHYREQENNDAPLKQVEYDEWVNDKKTVATKFFQTEYRQFVKGGIYFYGCPHELYLKTYAERLDSFLKYYPEACEMHFIKSELNKDMNYFISEKDNKNISFSLENRNDYLSDRASKLGYDITFIKGNKISGKAFNISKNQNHPFKQMEDVTSPQLKWHGTNVEIAELIKSLVESNKFDPELTQKEIFRRFSGFLDFPINETIGIRDFSKRIDKKGNLTQFLDKLKIAILGWHNQLDEKKKYR